MKNREIIEYVPREGWESWKRKQKIKSYVVEVLSWTFWILLLLIISIKL